MFGYNLKCISVSDSFIVGHLFNFHFYLLYLQKYKLIQLHLVFNVEVEVVEGDNQTHIKEYKTKDHQILKQIF